jgi:hypothetical protein
MTLSLWKHSFLLLGCAIAISVVLVFPIEQIMHQGYPPLSYSSGSCGDEEIGLNLGNIVQAILTPIFVFLLPGPGSIFYKKKKLASLPKPSVLIAAGCLCAALISFAWWEALRHYAQSRGQCAALYNWSLPVHSFKPDYVSDFFHYFIYLSGFSTLWVGVTAAGLRLQSARAAESDSVGSQLRVQGFYWACLLGWAVQYRISQWLALGRKNNQEWVLWAIWDFIFLTVSSVWALAFAFHLWRKKPRTRLRAIMRAYWGSFVIILLTTLTFWWLLTGALATLKPFVTWNVFGLAWAEVVGTWRWRALQKERLIAAVPPT